MPGQTTGEGMNLLSDITFENVGPSPSMRVNFSPRLNLLTGDNGLGKTFVLDALWWMLTEHWAGTQLWPNRELGTESVIACNEVKESNSNYQYEMATKFDQQREQWTLLGRRASHQPTKKSNEPLTLYVRVDGSIHIVDPIRRKSQERNEPSPPQPFPNLFYDYHFRSEDIWNGLYRSSHRQTPLCNGLILDWVTWSYRHPELYRTMTDVLAALSPDNEKIIPGDPVRISMNDARETPTITLPYGTVPVTQASAGMKRIIGLAYLLVWAWSEHVEAAKLSNQSPTDQLILLIDEVEIHLHPLWQRLFLPALFTAINRLSDKLQVQVVATTHSPLVLASIEPIFDESKDRVNIFEIIDGIVKVREYPWAKQGDVIDWLVSDVFGMRQARSKEAERAILAANAWMRGERDALPKDLANEEAIHQELLRVLADNDQFWPRWIINRENKH